MKWVYKIDQTSKYQSEEVDEARIKAIKRCQTRRKQTVVDGDKLRAFRAVIGLKPWKQIPNILKITRGHMEGVLNNGIRLKPEALAIVDNKLEEEGIEIKERVISFE